MPSNFRPEFPGYSYDRLRSVLENTGLSSDNPALHQLIFGLIDAAQKQETRFVTQIQKITKNIQVDNNGNISAKNLLGVNTGNVRFVSDSGIVTSTPSSNGQSFVVNNINLVTQITDDGAGLYNPTLTNVLNLDGSTTHQATYRRIGNIAYVFGLVDADPTAPGATTLGISLPIASNLGIAEDCCGVAASPDVAGLVAAIEADTVNHRAQMRWIAVDLTNRPFYYQFGYRVL